ncbi:MAG: hypothetical protein ACRCWY_11835 [Cellulosilyticaceae bacterium]
MLDRKWKVYVIHHSHTDIGYTDLQEKIMYNHMDYIRKATEMTARHKGFKWNCESYYCVEKYLEEATQEEIKDFIEQVKEGGMGLSANYLNFTDLVDKHILTKHTKKMVDCFKGYDIDVKVAMNADINGISMGALDAYVENGIEFLYTNIHCHHGMYPLYQNQVPFYWEAKSGKKLLVWSGEHYNLGNALGLVPNKHANFMTESYFGTEQPKSHVEVLKNNLYDYLEECQVHGYDYPFMITSVSGVFSDNAPPNLAIYEMIEAFNATYGEEVEIEMVTLQQLYENIKDVLIDIPTYQGDMTDWWAHGVGSTPYMVKHYKEAQRMYNLCEKLDPEHQVIKEAFVKDAEENLMLYAEHTWGHSSTITNPYDTMVQNLDIRKGSYASKAHEASAKNLNRLLHSKGDQLSYYDRDGKIKAINSSKYAGQKVVSFYIEVWKYDGVELTSDETGKVMDTQLSSHPRGVLISFLDNFEAFQEKNYTFVEKKTASEKLNRRVAYVGSERIKDIINTYDPVTYTLPYGIENDYFAIKYEIGKGVTSFYNKKEQKEMLMGGDAAFFTPIYECTDIRTDVYEERRLLGRNIRGLHAEKYQAQLVDVKCIDNGSVFTTIELMYKMEGTYHSSVVIRLYKELPKLEFKYKIAKTFTENIENVLLPLSLDLEEKTLFVDKGDVCFRPGVDQLPGSCMEYYLLDNGLSYETKNHQILIHTKDVPLIYMGELKHHPIQLCDNKEANNQRDVYSWVMNNIWETNFKMDLSGVTEFCYTLEMIPKVSAEESFEVMKEEMHGVLTFMTKEN